MINFNFKLLKPESISLHYIIGILFIFFALLPYVNFGLNSRDSQPWAFLFSSLFLLINYNNKLPILTYSYFLIPITAFYVWFFYSSLILDFIVIRAIVNYLTFSFCLIGFLYFLKDYGFPWKFFIVINLLYIIVGVIQLYLPDIVSSIVMQRGSRLSGRGVQSLASEPTSFGLVLFFFSFIYLVASNFKLNKKIYYLLAMNLFAIVFLAGSSMVILFLLLALVFVFFFISFRMKILSIFLLCLISFLVLEYLEGSRILFIVNSFAERGLAQYLFFDESVNDRLSHVIFSIHGSFLNNLMPGGFNSFPKIQQELMIYYEGFFYFPNYTESILSLFGAFVYELGIFGYLIMLFIFIHCQNGSISRLMTVIYLFIILNSAIPVAFPLVPFLIAILIHLNTKNKSFEYTYGKRY
jgi:hypothetical protein